jgi:hypothetical protein
MTSNAPELPALKAAITEHLNTHYLHGVMDHGRRMMNTAPSLKISHTGLSNANPSHQSCSPRSGTTGSGTGQMSRS